MKFTREGDQTKVVHSPAMCTHKGETFLTFYQCHNEGWSQEVVVLRKVKDKWEQIIKLPKGTGNPVLLSLKDKLYLAYSKFKGGTEQIRNVLFLWKNVDMFVAEINHIKNDKFDTWQYKDVSFFQNLCPRISALEFKHNDSALLPVYDESFGAGYVIVFHTGQKGSTPVYSMSRHSIMYNQYIPLIQPTLFLESGMLHFEARNFGGRRSTNGIEGTWDRDRGTWLVEKRSDFYNYRESVLRFSWNDVHYRVYGKDPNRTGLTLSCKGKEIKLNQLQHGCYPNYIINEDNTLTICFTEYNSRLSEQTFITLLTFNKELKLINKEQV